MVEDNQISCLYAMVVILFLNLAIIIFDSKIREKTLYVINAMLAAVEITTYLVLRSLQPGWGAEYPRLEFLPLVWLGSMMGVMLLSYFGLRNFFEAHRKTWLGKTGRALFISAHIVIIAVGLFILFGALYSFKWG